jgi:preprotein translocase SecE subunit
VLTVARESKRDKDRKRRRQQAKPEPGAIHRSDEPGALDHASGAADEVEAAIVAGAGGVPAEDGASDDVQGVDHPEDLSPEDFNRLEDDVDEAELEIEATGSVDEELELDHTHRATAHHVEGPAQGGPRFIRFLRASWAELRRVQWPDRRQVSQATAVVLGFVVVAGLYLGLADWAAKKVVDFII